MRGSLGWPRSADVMDLWLSRPARAMAPAEKQDGSLGPVFPVGVVDTALQLLKNTLDTSNARKVLASMGKTLPDGPGSAAGQAAASLHAQRQFQLAQVGDAGGLDDL